MEAATGALWVLLLLAAVGDVMVLLESKPHPVVRAAVATSAVRRAIDRLITNRLSDARICAALKTKPLFCQ
jgi:hypothetical protein